MALFTGSDVGCIEGRACACRHGVANTIASAAKTTAGAAKTTAGAAMETLMTSRT
ncbi:MAG TPA: hypothetical protein VIJ38_03735 [Acidobacteriaceae bacterium]